MKNYVVVPGPRHAGLFSYVLQALHVLSLADKTGDKVYIKYDKDMLYLDPKLGGNVWDYYFHQPFNFTKEEILENGKEEVIFIDNEDAINFHAIPRPSEEEINTARDLCKKYLKVKPHILDKVQSFIDNNFNGKKYFSIHRRGTDHFHDNPLLSVENYLKEADKLFEEYEYGLICTDENKTIDAFKNRYGDKIKSYDSLRCDNDQGIHYSVGALAPYKMGEDVMIESILMSKSDHLIKTVSGVSLFSIFYGSPTFKDIDLHLEY